MSANLLSTKADVRADAHGWVSYAVESIAAGETVAAFGGTCVSRAALDEAVAFAHCDGHRLRLQRVRMRSRLFITAPFSEPEIFLFPEGIGALGCVNVEHEEVILMPRWLDVGRARRPDARPERTPLLA